MIFQDFKYALRLLAKKPGFTVLTTLVMATGIGLSLYLFVFFNSVLFKDLPFKDSQSLVMVSASENGARKAFPLKLHDYQEIRDNLEGISEFGAFANQSVNVVGRDGARRYDAVSAESNIFQLTRTQPILGREFTRAENEPGAENVVVIGFDIWQNQFGGESQVIDQILRINGQSHRIIGVMPEGYYFPNVADLWLPLRKDASRLTRADGVELYGLAHVKDGASVTEINRQLAVIMQRIEKLHPKSNTGISAYIETLQMSSAGDGINVVYSMQIVAILILVLASINVGNLLLSRAVERSKETAIRVALGAPRMRLISQMVWESVIICTFGGIVGLLVVAWGLGVTETITATFFAEKPSFWWKFSVDAFTLKLFVAFVLTTIFVTGFLPAWKNSGGDFNAALRDGTRGALGKKAGRLNRVLVISEILISMTVLIGASVMVLSSYMQTHAEIGAESENTLTATLRLPELDYDTPEKQAQLIQTLQSRLENSTGIGDVMITSVLPGKYSTSPGMAIEGKEYTQDRGYPKANDIIVTPGTLPKLGVELKQGRYFNSSDEGQENTSVLVTESFVAQHFDEQSPLGKRLRFVEADGESPRWLTIVGIVEHTTQGDTDRGKLPSVFRPYSQAPRAQMIVAMRMKADRTVVTSTLRKTLKSIDPELPAFRVETYTQSLDRSTASIRFISKVLLLFGLAAIVLAGSGIYGVMSNTINQRVQEIGVKRALGANDGRITRELMISGGKQLLWGSIPGVLLGGGLGFVMGQVMGVGTTGIVFISLTIMTIISSVVMLATYLPTKRALKMEPGEALHYE